MRYDEALGALGRALAFGINPTLEGVTELLEVLGRPQDSFASIQVTGTNGKSSTCWLTAALLAAEGRRVGLYTSPHLERYPERIEIDGLPLTDEAFAAAVFAAVDAATVLRGEGAVGSPEGFTEFELLTAAALWSFREAGVEIAVLEVGLGGRWDATSVVSPSVAVITGVGLDHTAILGGTVEEIAADKAHIIKPASAPVLGPGTAGLDDIFLARADSLGTHARAVREGLDFSPVAEELTVRYRVSHRPSMPGGVTTVDVDGVHARYSRLALPAPSYQAANIATAVTAAEAALGRALHEDRARRALAALVLPARFEVVRRSPAPLIIDGSHNPQAATVLAAAIREEFPVPASRPVIVLGVLADKDAEGIVAALVPVAAAFIVTTPESPRALPAANLAEVLSAHPGVEYTVTASIAEALEVASHEVGRAVVVTGSLTTAGQARAAVRDA